MLFVLDPRALTSLRKFSYTERALWYWCTLILRWPQESPRKWCVATLLLWLPSIILWWMLPQKRNRGKKDKQIPFFFFFRSLKQCLIAQISKITSAAFAGRLKQSIHCLLLHMLLHIHLSSSFCYFDFYFFARLSFSLFAGKLRQQQQQD